MTFDTVVSELFERLPDLRAVYEVKLHYMLDEPPLAYLVFGSVLVPELERALRQNDLDTVTSIGSFFEEVAHRGQKDARLADLLRIEIGEWLEGTAHELTVAKYLGPETKRICKYVPGLAMQRLRLRQEKQESSLRSRISALFKRA
jgi:hypothetical protein